MTDAAAPKYPQHEKARALEDRRALAAELWDFIHEDKKLHLGQYHTHGDECYEGGDRDGELLCGLSSHYLNCASIPPEEFIAEFLGIDLKAFRAEKDAMVREVQAAATLAASGGPP